MKTFTLTLVLFLALKTGHTQDYLISFTATGASSSIDTMRVQNLTQGTSLTLEGTDQLHLVGSVGLEPVDQESCHSVCIYPNPAAGTCAAEFELPASCETRVNLFDLSGRMVCQSSQLLPAGKHTLIVGGLHHGVYTIRISAGQLLFSGKITCIHGGSGQESLDYLPAPVRPFHNSNSESGKSIIQMQYNEGDQLLITGYSGIYTTVIPLVPEQSMVLTINFIPCTDSEGTHYATVEVDSQVWMAENLDVGIRINGLQDQTNNGIREKYCYEDLESNCSTYGGLYQWEEMMQYSIVQGGQGLCPDGWHLPSDAEWSALSVYLGGENIAGGKMKETGTGHWASPNGEATNGSGFTALPGGFRFLTGSFSSLTTFCYFWSSTQDTDPTFAWYRDLVHNFGYIYRDHYNKVAGFSVRCVLD